MPISPKRMPFFGHIEELRRRLFVVVGVLLVTSVGFYFLSSQVYDILVAPVRSVIGHSATFTFDVLEGMLNRFKLGLWAGVVVSSPVIIYEVLAFFLPALKPKERRWFLWTFAAAVVLFIAGVLLCYFMILEPSSAWLVQQNGGTFRLMMRASTFLQFEVWFLVGFGVAFEVPVVVFYLVYFEVVPYAKLHKNWRVVWVVIVIVAAAITPDWSPISMGALSIAMIVLFEASMFLVRGMLRKKIAAQKDDDEVDDSGEDEA